MIFRLLKVVVLSAWLSASALASDSRPVPSNWQAEAESISQNIRAKHLPFLGILDPGFESPESGVVKIYTRGGDSAIWTGHYLAAEAYRYAVTRSPEALASVRLALRAIRALVEVTGTGLLARAVLPAAGDPRFDAVTVEEAHNGVHPGTWTDPDTGEAIPIRWLGETSRDQYAGVFFGLSAAYQRVEVPEIREEIAGLVTKMLDFLVAKKWWVLMPGEKRSLTTFLTHRYQIATLMQIGQHVNPAQFKKGILRFLDSAAFRLHMGFEAKDDYSSFYKFNLAMISSYSLIGLESDPDRRSSFLNGGYRILRSATDGEGNAHFNMIDRALRGPDPARDAQTVRLLGEWLTRPRLDFSVDRTGEVEVCAHSKKKIPIACEPMPVPLRINTDFLWQRSSRQLAAKGSGCVETPGIDFILPYWMARYYGVL